MSATVEGGAGRALGAVAVALAIVMVAAGSAAAQVNMQLSGTVESVEGTTLTLITKAPPARRVTLGETVTPPPPPTLIVDVEGAPASQWVFLRPGDRIAVVGVPSADGRRFAAIRVIGGSSPPRAPETPQAP